MYIVLTKMYCTKKTEEKEIRICSFVFLYKLSIRHFIIIIHGVLNYNPLDVIF